MSAPKDVTVIVVPADPSASMFEAAVGRDVLRDLQELVGGNIQYLPFPHPTPGRGEVTPFFNEDGKDLDLPVNERATLLLRGNMLPGDVIVGTLVLAGATVDGATVDCPTTVAHVTGLIDAAVGKVWAR